MHWLSRAAVKAAVSMPEAIEAAARAYEDYVTGRSTTPVRTQLPVPEQDGVSLFMPAYSPGEGRTGLKIVSVYPGNAQKNLPTITGLVILLDSASGAPLAAMEAGYLTSLRTGAGAGAATRVLARRDAKVAAVIGTGGQAPQQVAAIAAVRPLEEIRLFNRTEAKAQALAEELQQEEWAKEIRFSVAPSAETAVDGADVITAVTTSTTPVFPFQAVKPGAHVNGVGSFRPDMRELPEELLLKARLFVDSREAVMEEAGEFIAAVEAGRLRLADLTEVGRVIAGQAAGRQADEEITVFKSVGIALQDLTTAALAYGQAVERNLGQSLDLY